MKFNNVLSGIAIRKTILLACLATIAGMISAVFVYMTVMSLQVIKSDLYQRPELILIKLSFDLEMYLPQRPGGLLMPTTTIHVKDYYASGFIAEPGVIVTQRRFINESSDKARQAVMYATQLMLKDQGYPDMPVKITLSRKFTATLKSKGVFATVKFQEPIFSDDSQYYDLAVLCVDQKTFAQGQNHESPYHIFMKPMRQFFNNVSIGDTVNLYQYLHREVEISELREFPNKPPSLVQMFYLEDLEAVTAKLRITNIRNNFNLTRLGTIMIYCGIPQTYVKGEPGAIITNNFGRVVGMLTTEENSIMYFTSSWDIKRFLTTISPKIKKALGLPAYTKPRKPTLNPKQPQKEKKLKDLNIQDQQEANPVLTR